MKKPRSPAETAPGEKVPPGEEAQPAEGAQPAQQAQQPRDDFVITLRRIEQIMRESGLLLISLLILPLDR